MLEGKGMFLWIVKRMFDNDPDQIDPLELADYCQWMGLKHIEIKVADGTWRYNLRPPNWTDDIVRPVVDAMHSLGIQVYGYQYVYGNYPVNEANRAIERVYRLKLDGLVIDAEHQYKQPGKDIAARQYMGKLTPRIGVPVGLSSYRYPLLHRELPWDEFLEKCDFHMPQVYWASATNPAQQLHESIRQLRMYADLPIFPAGAAYREHGWQPTGSQLNEFDQAVKDESLKAITWWEMWWARYLQFDKTIRNHEWGEQPPAPPTLEQRVSHLELEARERGWDV